MRVNKTAQYLFLVLTILLFSCSFNKNQEGVFVSTKNNMDTLIINADGTYIRKSKYASELNTDKGEWFYEDDRIWFYDWINRGEAYDFFKDGKPRLIPYSFSKSITGKVKEIYFDVDNYYYYEKIK